MPKTCAVCAGDARPATTSYTFEREARTLVVKDVPADVCVNCGEAFVNDLVAGHLLEMAARNRRSGEPYAVEPYAA
ncbi:MAG: type II toxin-antitoxin system MqsA family antitoxin [Acidimicrobiia bacterium]